MRYLLLILLLLTTMSGLPAPNVINYQQSSLANGGLIKTLDNVTSISNWLEVTVICSYGSNRIDPAAYNCLAGVGAVSAVGTYSFQLILHTYDRVKRTGMDRWRLVTPFTGKVTIYSGTEFVCASGCLFNQSYIQMQGMN